MGQALTYGGNVNHYKSVHQPLSSEHPGSFQNKLVSSSFKWVTRYILFLIKLKGKERPFLEGARMRTTMWDYPEVPMVIIREGKCLAFFEIENNLTLPYKFLDALTNTVSPVLQCMEFYDKFVDRFWILSKESHCHKGEGVVSTEIPQETVLENMMSH